MARPSVAFVGPLERVLSLRALPMLEMLSADELAVIAQHTRERNFAKGSALLDTNMVTTAAYVILDGRVRLQRGTSSEEVGPNESIGFIDLLARSPTGVSAQALVDTQTLELDWEAQLDVCEQYFSIFLRYVQYLCQRAMAELSPLAGPAEAETTDSDSVVSSRPLNLVERAQIFRKSPLFSRCSPDAIWELMRHVTEVRFDPNEPLWQTGSHGRFFVMIVSGLVRCTDGTNTVLAGSGRTMGMLETVTFMTRWYGATAASHVTALKIDREAFLDILEDHFDMAIEFAGAIARGVLRNETRSTLRIA